MEVVEKKEESTSPTKAAIEFHRYSRLPPELKLKIWEKVFEDWSPGAHRFCLTIRPSNPTRLTVRPDRCQNDDRSAWRERRALARVDKYSLDGLLKFERSATTLYKDTSRRHTVKVEENGVTAMVDGRTDLIILRLNYGTTRASLSLLDIKENSELFANITQIAIDEELFRGWSQYKPFACACPAHPGDHRRYCVAKFVRFIRFFKDLKVFYLAVSVKLENLELRADILKSLPLEPPRLCYAKHGMSQVSLNVFRRIQEITQQKGLSQFHDRMGTYCEVLKEDGIHLLDEWFWEIIDNLESAWSHRNTKYNWGRQIEFKVAVWADLRGVTVSGIEQPLRTRGPWY